MIDPPFDPPLDPPAHEPAPNAPRSPFEIFVVFSMLSLQAFGGALALLERTLVREKQWLGAKEFLGIYAVSQVLPGPSGMSFCVMIGDRFFGVRGAAAALAGFVLPPSVLLVGLVSAFAANQHLPMVQGALQGMGAAALGTIITTFSRMALELKGHHAGIVVALLCFLAVGILRTPVSWVVLTLGAVSVALAWRGVR